MDNYSESIVVNCSAKEAYGAILNGLQDWWTNSVTYIGTDQTFTVNFGSSFKTFRVIKQEAGRSIHWRCDAALIDHQNLDKRDEWVGTEVVWTIENRNTSSLISLTHRGLTQDLECFSICRDGWNFFFLESLKNYLDTGVGKPFNGS